MIYLLHGLGSSALGQKLDSLKKQYSDYELTEVDLKQSSLQELRNQFLSQSLFSSKRLIILDNLDEKLALDELSVPEGTVLIFKAAKAVSVKSLLFESLKKAQAQILFFDESRERSIFPLLDQLSEKNNQALKDYQQYLSEFGLQYLLTMFFYQLRKFIKPGNIPQFTLPRYQKQKQNFPLPRVASLYKELLEIDYQFKNGKIDEPQAAFLAVNCFYN